MSEYGAGVTAKRKDGKEITEEEAEKLAESMNTAAKGLGLCGFFEEEPDCALGWEEDDGGFTLVATSSAAYHADTPKDIMEDGMKHDIEYAEKLVAALEKQHPGVYEFSVDEQEW